ncbi:MAG: hypothetical protein QW098_06310 [Candidatus Hadarchaeales archaeon]
MGTRPNKKLLSAWGREDGFSFLKVRTTEASKSSGIRTRAAFFIMVESFTGSVKSLSPHAERVGREVLDLHDQKKWKTFLYLIVEKGDAQNSLLQGET